MCEPQVGCDLHNLPSRYPSIRKVTYNNDANDSFLVLLSQTFKSKHTIKRVIYSNLTRSDPI